MSKKLNIPRPLTEGEINEILSGIEPITWGLKSATKLAQDQIKDLLRTQLQSIELVPAAIPEMKKIIRNQYNRSQVEPQNPVGFLVSEALSQPITQMTLNTFHQSGSSKNMSSGIDALRELFNVSEARKAYNMVINFNNCNLDYDEVFDMRTQIVEVSFESLIKKFDYLPGSQEKPAWTNGYLRLTKQAIPSHEWSLRLYLDTNRMLAFKISISKIIQMIRDKAPPHIVVVPSPMSIGILDLYPDEQQMDTKQLGLNSSLLFLSVTVLPTIQEFVVSGVKGVEGIFPTSNPILSIITEEIPVEKDGNVYYLAFSRSQMIKTGIGLNQLEKLFSFVDIEILSPKESGISAEEGAYVVMPEAAKSGNGYQPPLKFVRDLLSKEESIMDDEEKRVKQEAVMLQTDKSLSPEDILRIQSKARGYMAKPSEFYKASKCWYAETNGKNFIEVIKLPEVDPLHTYSNDFHEIADILGIEATRSLLIMEFKNVLLSEEYINVRHIALLVDIMTNLGRLTPISFYGANRFGQGAMSLATNQQTMKVFTQAAAFGKKEKVDSVSASIMVGKQAKIGAGFVEVLPAKSKISIPQPNPVQFGDKIDEVYATQILEQDQNVETNEQNKKAYNDLMTVTIPSKIYTREETVMKKVVPTDVSVAPPKLISPNLIQMANSIKTLEVIGEVTLENSVTVNPEENKEITKAPSERDTTITEKIELNIPEEPSVTIPPVSSAPISFVKKPKTAVAPEKGKEPEKKTIEYTKMLAKKKLEEKRVASIKKTPLLDVDKSINTLQDL